MGWHWAARRYRTATTLQSAPSPKLNWSGVGVLMFNTFPDRGSSFVRRVRIVTSRSVRGISFQHLIRVYNIVTLIVHNTARYVI